MTEMKHCDAYDAVAIAFHWLLAVAITASFSVGVYMHDLPLSPLRLKLWNWHKWAGIAILAFSAARLLWRLAHRPPPLAARVLAAMPGWQRHAHEATHIAMYLLFFCRPADGSGLDFRCRLSRRLVRCGAAA